MERSNFPSIWFSNLPKDKQKEFEAAVRNSIVVSRLRQILTDRLQQIEKVELTDNFYSLPEVSHRQSHNSGRSRELQQMLDLLTF